MAKLLTCRKAKNLEGSAASVLRMAWYNLKNAEREYKTHCEGLGPYARRTAEQAKKCDRLASRELMMLDFWKDSKADLERRSKHRAAACTRKRRAKR